MASVEIRISDIRKIVNRLLDHIEMRREVGTVELSKNFYWEIAPEKRFEMESDPSADDIQTGSLEDDWEFVSGLLRDEAEPVSLQLTELAPLLDFIGRALGE